MVHLYYYILKNIVAKKMLKIEKNSIKLGLVEKYVIQ